MKYLTLSQNEIEPEDGIFLINPQLVHLDESEIKEKIEKGEKLFKMKVEEI